MKSPEDTIALKFMIFLMLAVLSVYPVMLLDHKLEIYFCLTPYKILCSECGRLCRLQGSIENWANSPDFFPSPDR